ncbi:hypothetical protein ACH4Q7_22785 [Streptomyces roseolus]|uniref:hypothetical protein n=1 Tax=Streptomyces roseolus TaxID=67358 RepID=UPI003799EE92
MLDLTDDDVRSILREYRNGGAISRLYATGEITRETLTEIGVLTTLLDEEGKDEAAERLWDVIGYLDAVGERPPVKGWTAKL